MIRAGARELLLGPPKCDWQPARGGGHGRRASLGSVAILGDERAKLPIGSDGSLRCRAIELFADKLDHLGQTSSVSAPTLFNDDRAMQNAHYYSACLSGLPVVKI